MTKIRTIVIDDEQEARDGICFLLAQRENFEVVATCENGLDAINAIEELEPDLIFLDIQMPKINGFEVLNSLDSNKIPKVVFVTAYDKYALQAFEVHATDYLLKPFTDQRFFEALDHLEEGLAKEAQRKMRLMEMIDGYFKDNSNHRTEELISTQAQNEPPQQLIVKTGGKIVFIALEHISHISARNYYVQIHTKNGTHLVRESLKSLEAYLANTSFLRIHKSVLVNSNAILEVEPYFNGQLVLKLKNGETLKVSRHYRNNLPRIFG